MARRARARSRQYGPQTQDQALVSDLVGELRGRGERFTNKRRSKSSARRSSAPVRRGRGGRGNGESVQSRAKAQALLIKAQSSAANGKKMSYNQLGKDVGVQIGCFVSENAAALVTTGALLITDVTESTSDDKVVPWIISALGNGARVASDRWLSKDHPGLARVLSAGASAANGVAASRKFVQWGVKYTKAVESKSGR